jgi:hypothetical protein
MKTLGTIFLQVATVAVAFFLSASFRTEAATITWTNTASGGWNTAANWNPNTVPGSADTAIITNAGVTVSLNGATTVGAIILGANGPGTVTLSLAFQMLALNGPLTVNPSGSFTVDSGLLVGNTNAVLNGTIGWSAGVLEGILTLSSGSTLTLTTGNNHDIPSCAFTNNGTVVWSAGEIRGGGNPGTVIYNNGVWDAQNDSTWDAAYAAYGTVFNNAGTFRKSGSAGGNTTFQGGTTFNQLAGKLDSQTNSIVLSGGGNFTGGMVTNLAGFVVLNGGAFNINGTVTSTNVQFAGGATLTGNNVISGGLNWIFGAWNNSTETIATNTTVLITTVNNHDLAGCTVTNNGTVVWSAGLIRAGGNPGTVIYNNGVWDAQNDSTWNEDYAAYGTVFNNAGTFRKSGSTGGNTTFQGGTTFNQLTGKLDSQTNSIVLSGGGNFTGGMATNLAGFVVLNGGAFNINGTVTSTNVQLAGATLTGNNVISGGLNWISGAWNYSTETIATNTTVLITTVNYHDLAGCTVTNNGMVVWSAGLIRAGGNPGTVIYNNGVWDAQNDSTWNEDYSSFGTVFNNAGTLRKSGSAGGNTTIATSVFNNTGTIDAQTNSIVFQTDANFSPGSVFNGAGSTILSSGTFNINGATINSTLQLNGGNIGGTNTLSGTFIWNGGSFINATLMITISGTLNIDSGNTHDMPGCTLINNGTVVWSTGEIRGGGNPGTVVYNNGVWNAQDDSTWNNDYAGNGTVFNNAGTFRKSGSAGGNTTFPPNTIFNNTGTLDAQHGVMLFSGSFANSACILAVENGATIQIAQPVVLPGGLVTGSGTVQAPSITSSAVVNPGATNAVLNLAGNYTQLLGGSMQFDIGGTSPGVNQSQVNVTGSASLSGLIGLRFSPGYVPAVNSSNMVLTAGSRSGQFNFQDHFFLLGQNKRINPVYSPTNLVLTTIAATDPANFSLSTAVQGQAFALAWPSEFGNYGLYVKTNVEDLNWTSVPGITNFYMETPMTSPHKFFRLF